MDTERVKELKTFTNDFNLKLKNAFDQFNNNVYSLIKSNRRRKAFSNRITKFPYSKKEKENFCIYIL